MDLHEEAIFSLRVSNNFLENIERLSSFRALVNGVLECFDRLLHYTEMPKQYMTMASITAQQ